MTGYQKLKKENEKLRRALWEIFILEGTDLKEAQHIAANTLYGNLIWVKTNEKK